jgi:hypothetical protein
MKRFYDFDANANCPLWVTLHSLVALTLIFIALPLALGSVLLRKTIQTKGQLSKRDRVAFYCVGIS